MSDYSWNNPSGGAFDVAGNWSPGTAYPGPADTADFTIPDNFIVSGNGTADFIDVSDNVTFTGGIEVIGPPAPGFTAFVVNGGTAEFDGGTLLSLQEVQVGNADGHGLVAFIDGATGTLYATDSATALDIGYDYLNDVNAGTVSVDGSASVLTLYGGAYVGVFSPGTLAITDNGAVQVLASTAGYNAFEVASASGSSGTIDVDTGGTLSVDEASFIGNSGTGAVSFNDSASGYFSANVEIGANADAGGTLNLANGSELTINQSLMTGAGNSVLGVASTSGLQVLGAIEIGGGGGSAYASVTDFGVIDDSGGVTVAALGTLAIDPTGVLELNQAATLDAGTLSALGADTLPISIEVTGGTEAFPSALTGASGADLVITQGITFATGASAALLLGPAFDISNVISNFASGDLLDVQISPTVFNTASYDVATSQLVLSDVMDAPLVLDLANGGYFPHQFNVSPDGSGGTDVVLGPPCYVAGTNILTDHGEVAVEDLRIGDRLITRSGAARPLRWIGRRAYAASFVAASPHLWPVRIAAGALDERTPTRDLCVSPCHAMYFDHLLVPAAALVNGTTISRVQPVADVVYYHVELTTHEVIFAEGALAETYIDLNNRNMFQNAAEYAAAADFPAAGVREYAPRVEQSAGVSAIRLRLAARASAMGHTRARVFELPLDAPGLIRATIPPGTGALFLRSQTAHTPGDHRPLGALLRGLRLDGVRLALADRSLLRGFHELERHGDQVVRWTNGDAVITLVPTASARCVEIDVAALCDRRRAA